MGGSGRRSSRSNRAGEVQGQGEGDGSIVRYRERVEVVESRGRLKNGNGGNRGAR